MTSRRELLMLAAGACASALVPQGVRAAAPDRPRLLVALLRGALDGLAAVPPVGDPRYAGLRGALALDAGEALRLDAMFGLHPALESAHALYRDGEFTVVHALATPYRERSHFDAQNVLESGLASPSGAADGWLNRVLAEDRRLAAVAIGQRVPLILRGAIDVSTWAPSLLAPGDPALLARLADLYEHDPLLSQRLQQAVAADGLEKPQARAGAGTGAGGPGYMALAQAAARFLAPADGPSVAVVDIGGWDTHAAQGAAQGALGLRLRGLDALLRAWRAQLGSAWRRTVVVMATEFGRTAAANGTGGTDHGTASAALLAGGALAGGRVVADWPGLARLYQGRDLTATGDLRALFKGVLRDHLGIDAEALDARVFPGSAAVRPIEGLIRHARGAAERIDAMQQAPG
ncbi:MAG: DUF1501 domain-containing protein [Gammaproteobacteria bacterium]